GPASVIHRPPGPMSIRSGKVDCTPACAVRKCHIPAASTLTSDGQPRRHSAGATRAVTARLEQPGRDVIYTRRTSIGPLVPPNPKEFDNAYSMLIFRASLAQ